MKWSPDAATSSVFATLGFNALLGFVVMVVFEYFRVHQLDIYSPKVRKDANEEIPVPTSTLFGWIPNLWKLSDDDMLRIAGLDAYVYLRYIKMLFRIGLLCCCGLPILLPVYVTAAGLPDVEGINKYSMANIELQGMRLWASVVFAYLFTCVFLFYIDREYENFARARTLFFNGVDKTLPDQMAYTVIVENIPEEYRTSDKLRDFFETLFPGEVLHASMAVFLKPLDDAVNERKQLMIKLEQANAEWEASGRKQRPKLVLPSKYISCLRHIGSTNLATSNDATTDAIEFYSDQIAIVSEEIALLQTEAKTVSTGDGLAAIANIVPEFIGESAKALQERFSSVKNSVDNKLKGLVGDIKIDLKITEKMVSGSALVTFKSRRIAAVAAQIPILSAKAPAIKIQPAPAPSDIVWSNMDASTEHTESVAFFTSLMYYGGLLFWSVVLAFISLISNLSYLQKYLPFLKSLDTTSYAFLQGILPVVVMLVFLSLVPSVMAFVAQTVERRKTNSAIQLEVFRWYFLYQIANVYLLLIAGSTITSISDVVDNPAAFLQYISAALPTTSVFFINFTITQTFSGVPLNIVNLFPFLYYGVIRLFVPEKYITRRTLFEGPLAPATMAYGTALPGELYQVSIMLLYWIISPILLVIATFYFGANYIALKYNFTYVLTRDYESGGLFWYGLYDYSMLALMFSSVTFIVYVSIKQGAIQAPALVPLPFLIIFAWRYTEKKYKAWSMNVPYSTAVTADFDSAEAEKVSMFTEDYLKHPDLLAPRTVYPYPYRIAGHSRIINERGLVDAVYLEDVDEGVDPNEALRNFVARPTLQSDRSISFQPSFKRFIIGNSSNDELNYMTDSKHSASEASAVVNNMHEEKENMV